MHKNLPSEKPILSGFAYFIASINVESKSLPEKGASFMNQESGIFERRSASEGSLIMREGEPGNCAYLVQSGRVVVFTEHGGQKIELARLGVGEIFGEMALASDMPRSASVQALEECNLIIITREVLSNKLARSDSTVQAIVKMLINRMNQSNEALTKKKTSIKELMRTNWDIYNNILSTLPKSQRKTFENGVRPKLDDFIETLQTFEKRFSKK